MLGLAPIATAPIADDGERLPQILAGALGDIALGGKAGGAPQTGAVSQMVLPPVSGVAGGIGNIRAHGSGSSDAEGNTLANGPVGVVAAGRFVLAIGATAHIKTRAANEGAIALTAQGDARTGISSVTRSEWALGGGATARAVPLANGLGHLDVSGDAHGRVSLQSGVLAALTIARQLEAEGVASGDAEHGIAIEGTTEGGSHTDGASEGGFGLGGRAFAGAVQSAAANGAMDPGGFGQAQTRSTARASDFGPLICGFAVGTRLEARVAQSAGRLGLGAGASAAVKTHAITDASVFVGLDARGNVNTRSAIAGGLSLSRELDGDVLATGHADRHISLAGAACAVTLPAADAPAVELRVTGTSQARSSNRATIRHALSACGETELASTVSGAARTTFEWLGAADTITGTRAVVETEASLQEKTFTATSINAFAIDHLAMAGNSACDATPVAQLRGELTMAADAWGTVSALGLGRGVFDVARDFGGDVDVSGESARAMGLAGQATADSTTTGSVLGTDVKLLGCGAATSISFAAVATQISLLGETSGQGLSAAFVQPRLEIGLLVDGACPRTAKSNGTWVSAGHADGKLALVGSADCGLGIGSDAAARATLATRASGVCTLTGKTTSVLVARADAEAVLAIGRDSDAAVEIDGDVSRTISIHGSCEARASITAKLRPLHLALGLITNAANAVGGGASSAVTTAGSGIAQVQSQAVSLAHLVVSRTGAADVPILGAAWRGMPFLGASRARTPALAAANSSVTPRLAAAAANVIHLDFNAEAIAPGGQAAGSNLACAQDVSAQWDLGITAIAFRAPPALGRSEPPRLGLSGRLVPSNSGRVLRG